MAFGWDDLAVGVGMKVLGDQLSSNSAKSNAEFQNTQTLDQMRKAPSAQMQGLRDAGLNPMLAYNQLQMPMSSANVSMAYSDLPTSAAAVKQADTSSDVARAGISKIAQEITNLQTDNERARAVIDNVRVEYQNLIKQGYNLTETGNEIRARIQQLKASVPLLNSQSFNQEMLGQLNKLDVDAASKFDNFGREFQQYKPVIDLLKHLFRPFGGHQ